MYRVWDNTEKRFRDDIVVSPMGNFLILDSIDSNTVCYYGGRDYKRFIVEQGFKVGDKVFYEGDIVIDPDKQNKNFQIDFSDGSFSGFRYGDYLSSELLKYCKLIGNIHENPELLEK